MSFPLPHLLPLLPLLPLPPVPPYQLSHAAHQHSPARCPILSPRGDSQMISMTPEQAAFLLQYQLPSVKNEYRTTSAIIAAIPASNVDYRPDTQAPSAAEIAWHIAATEHRFYNAALSAPFHFSAIPRPRRGIPKQNILQ